MTVRVKVCGITTTADAEAACECGADWIGVNFVRASPRAVAVDTARAIVRAVGGRAVVVGVVADVRPEDMADLLAESGVDRLQLHGDEPPDHLERLLPRAFKALRIGSAADVREADRYPGDPLLVDARVAGARGGTGRTFDWSLVANLAGRRPLLLAGGLCAENVAAAVARVRPWGVDVASGVEMDGDVRRKSRSRMAEFVRAARSVASPGG